MANYTLDIKKTGSQFTVEGIRVGDSGMRSLSFHFCDGHSSFQIPNDCIATLFATLPDKDGTTIFSTCEILDNRVKIPLCGSTDGSASLTSFPGRAECEIRLTTGDNGVLTSPRFSLMVEDTLQKDGAIEAESGFSALTDALARVLEAEAGLDSKLDKVDGVEGNVVVVGRDGNISDSGISVNDISENYVFIYDESKEQNAYNRNMFSNMRSALDRNKRVNAFLVNGDITIPASYTVGSSYIEIIALLSDCTLKVRLSNSGNVTYRLDYTFNSDTFEEESTIPASQESTANWVKQLINDSIAEGAW